MARKRITRPTAPKTIHLTTGSSIIRRLGAGGGGSAAAGAGVGVRAASVIDVLLWLCLGRTWAEGTHSPSGTFTILKVNLCGFIAIHRFTESPQADASVAEAGVEGTTRYATFARLEVGFTRGWGVPSERAAGTAPGSNVSASGTNA